MESDDFEIGISKFVEITPNFSFFNFKVILSNLKIFVAIM